jgi:hypothetical protein
VIDLTVGKKEAPDMLIDRPVSEDELESQLRPLGIESGLVRVAAVKVQVFLLAHREIRLDGIDGRDRGHRPAGRAHQRADLRQRLSGDPRDRRHKLREFEVHLRCLHRGFRTGNGGCGHLNLRPRGFHCSFGRLDLSLRGHVGLGGIVEVLLGDGLLLRERDVAVLVELGLGLIRFRHQDLRLCLRELRLRLRALPVGLSQSTESLIERCLERPRIDFEKQLTLGDERTLGVILFEQVAGNLRLDFRVEKAIERSNPLAVDGDVLLLDRRHLDNGRSRRFTGGRAGRTGGPADESHDQKAGQSRPGIQGRCVCDDHKGTWTPTIPIFTGHLTQSTRSGRSERR